MYNVVTKLPERIVHILQDFGENQDDWKLKLANEITRIIRDYLPRCVLPEKDVSYTSEISRMAYIYRFCCSVLPPSKLHSVSMIVLISKLFSIAAYITN